MKDDTRAAFVRIYRSEATKLLELAQEVSRWGELLPPLSEEGQRLAESLVKGMTGGDTLAARFLHHEWFEFIPTFKIFLATNHKPIVRGTDCAIWRRIKLVPFAVTIPNEEQDKQLGDKLKTELPGILAWAAEGCKAWQREGLGEPEEVHQATASYHDEMDPLAGFIADRCVVSNTAQTPVSALYKAYQEWCDQNGERVLPSNAFGRRMTGRGIIRFKEGGKRCYLGIGLVEPGNDHVAESPPF